jgi:high-affinity iron transporter
VYREGFETVLFLQALQLSSGTGIVLAGVSLGLVATAAVGVATFALERRLPYKRMLVVTGVLIALVLFVLVGNTMRTLQGVGWLGITPIDIELPLWTGTWLGVHPTVETLAAQFASLVFVIGSYYAAELVRKRPRVKAGPRPSPSVRPSSHDLGGEHESTSDPDRSGAGGRRGRSIGVGGPCTRPQRLQDRAALDAHPGQAGRGGQAAPHGGRHAS